MLVGAMPYISLTGLVLFAFSSLACSSKRVSAAVSRSSIAWYVVFGMYLFALFCCVAVYWNQSEAVITIAVLAALSALSFASMLFMTRRHLDSERERRLYETKQYRSMLKQLISERVSAECSLKQYAAELSGDNADREGLMHKLDSMSGSSVAEILVAHKRELSRKLGIEYAVEQNGRIIALESVEIVMLLGNLLDNAIEAARTSGRKNPYVRGSINCHAGLLSIDLSNSKSETVTMRRRDYIVGKPKKGIGTNQIASVIEAYDGKFTLRDAGDELRIGIRLHLPKSEEKEAKS